MTTEAPFPRPRPGPLEAPFWEWCRRGELRIQRCSSCGSWRHHPRPRCAVCRSDAYEWARASGRGTLHSWTICHPPVLPAFADKVPYNVIVVELAEGPFMVSNLVDGHDEDLVVGMGVEVTMVSVDGDLVLPAFRPVDGTGSNP